MLRHFLEVKADHPDAIVFYRMGDFFELFFEDAQIAAPILEVTLTARGKGTANETPMCGVPHHALEGYVGKLLKRGLKVAICDQVEDPKQAKGLVKREVTRVMTPGTLSEPSLLEGDEDNYLAALTWEGDAGAGAFLDLSTGSFFVRRWNDELEAEEDLELLRPKEVIAPKDLLPAGICQWIGRRDLSHTELDPELVLEGKAAESVLLRQLEVQTLKGFGLARQDPATKAAAMALGYAQDTQRSDLGHIKSLRVRQTGETLVLDPTTLANLEVLRSLREGGRQGSLLSVLDKTRTAPGGRKLQNWLRQPLRSEGAITARYEVVEDLLTHTGRRHRIREGLSGFGDPERLATRAVLGSLKPREAGALRECLRKAPGILEEIGQCPSGKCQELASVDHMATLLSDLENTLHEEPPASRRDGGLIAEGVDEELDRCRSLARDSKQHILNLELREREATGISSLKIRYNRVFGYYLEVTKANQHLVPEHYERKQTLVNAERYITPEVKELEEQVLNAEERQMVLEELHYTKLLSRIAERATPLAALAAAISEIDVLASFAEVCGSTSILPTPSATRRGFRSAFGKAAIPWWRL